MNFGQALDCLSGGMRVCRQGWNGKGLWIEYQAPVGPITNPFLVIVNPPGHPVYPNGSRIPWVASQSDVLAEDWVICE